ncbi:hypothetical protein OURE66S_04016 [Oligella ureolytica]
MNQTADMLRGITKELGTAGLLITHDIEESFRIVDYVYMLHQGAVIAEGTPEQIRSHELIAGFKTLLKVCHRKMVGVLNILSRLIMRVGIQKNRS